MRTIWNGSLSFGLVNIPVGLALATSPKARASDVSFRQLHRECLTPIRQKRWCPMHDREVGPDEIVKGWEVAKGEFVIVEDADLEAIQLADDSRAIDITRFVPLDQVDPVYFDRTYYLSPANTAAQRRPYVLLLEALKDTGMAAVGRFVLRGQETFCLIRPRGEALALETLFLAEDVRSQAEIEEAVERDAGAGRRARPRAAGDRQPRRGVRAEGARERLPRQPARAARGEARRPGDHEAGAGRGRRAGDRPDGGAARVRRAGVEEDGAGEEAGARAQDRGDGDRRASAERRSSATCCSACGSGGTSTASSTRTTARRNWRHRSTRGARFG